MNTDIDNLRWQLQNDNNRHQVAIDGQSNKLDALVDKTAGLEGKLTQLKNDVSNKIRHTENSENFCENFFSGKSLKAIYAILKLHN